MRRSASGGRPARALQLQFSSVPKPYRTIVRSITLTKHSPISNKALPPATAAGALKLTKEMIEQGAKALEQELWKLDPFAKPYPLGALKLIIEKVYRAMAASAGLE
jgi:hypothetical protein